MEFKRLSELKDICEQTNKNKDCCYFYNFDNVIAEDESSYYSLENELEKIDDNEWSFFKAELTPYLYKKDKKRGWTQLFNRFNEAKAYGYLLNMGCSSVSFIPTSDEAGVQTPDLLGEKGEGVYLCEVKTINESDCQRKRVINREAASVVFPLSDGLRNQITSVVCKAKKQLTSYKCENVLSRIIYLLIKNDHWQSKPQLDPEIREHLRSLSEDGIEIKFSFL